MKRLPRTAILIVFASLLVTGSALAQGPEPIEVADLFVWAQTAPPDWGRGALFAGLGLIGALVTVFGLVGGAVPGTAGQARIDADTGRLEEMSKRLEELIKAPKPDAKVIEQVRKAVNELRDDLDRERWRQFRIATVLYALLGSFFSALMARDMLQALVIGAGWTSLIGTLGLKRDYAERKAIKDTALEKSLSTNKALKTKAERKGAAVGVLGIEPFEELEMEVRVAQRV